MSATAAPTSALGRYRAAKPATKPQIGISEKPWGLPGEEHKLWVVPLMKGQTPPAPSTLGTGQGRFRVQLLLSRPGYPVTSEREHRFIDELIGDSHIVITKPLAERSPSDPTNVILLARGNGRQVEFVGLPNEGGYLGKLTADAIFADSFDQAEALAYEAVAPFLSAWSLQLDIPVHLETTQVTNLETHTSALRVRTPSFEMQFAGGETPALSEEFCQYASLYREGMNSNSVFYRFLCFYKIIESLFIRRTRVAEADKKAGGEPQRVSETIPSDNAEILTLLKKVYPWRTQWDSLAIAQIVPVEARGKKIGWLRQQYLGPLRVGIAHALLKTGEVRVTLDKLKDQEHVNKWLPLCRILARLMLHNDFPTEFQLEMKPLWSNLNPR